MAIFNIRLLQGGLIFLFSCMTLDVKVFWTLTSRHIFLNNDQFAAYVEHNIISNGPSWRVLAHRAGILLCQNHGINGSLWGWPVLECFPGADLFQQKKKVRSDLSSSFNNKYLYADSRRIWCLLSTPTIRSTVQSLKSRWNSQFAEFFEV